VGHPVFWAGKLLFIGLWGVQGRSPCTSLGWPAVPRAAVSASARGGSRKKVFEKQNWCWENLLNPLFFIVE